MSVRLIGWAMLVFAWSSVVEAAEIKVLSAGAVKAVIVNVGDQFEKESGHKLSASFGTVGVTRQKLTAEPADVVIMTDVAIDEAIRQGSVVAGTRNDIARAGVGVGVKEGAPKPDISTPEAFKQTLLAAKAPAYCDPAQGATTGIHFTSERQRLRDAPPAERQTDPRPGG